MNIPRWSYLGIILISILLSTSSNEYDGAIKNTEVSWSDPSADRTNYKQWYSYMRNKPQQNSRSGFFFVDGNNVYWSYFNTECIPYHKHIRLVGHLNGSYSYSVNHKNCRSRVLKDENNLRWIEECDGIEYRDWTLYPYTN
jgi:hypothetical protein